MDHNELKTIEARLMARVMPLFAVQHGIALEIVGAVADQCGADGADFCARLMASLSARAEHLPQDLANLFREFAADVERQCARTPRDTPAGSH